MSHKKSRNKQKQNANKGFNQNQEAISEYDSTKFEDNSNARA